MNKDNVIPIGGNANADLKGRAQELAGVLDDIADLQERAKEIKGEAKLEGYDMKAFNQVVKEMRKGASYQASQLELELVLDTYRRGAGLPVTLEDAQERVRAEGGEMPEEKKPKRGGKPGRFDA
ncbi:MAG: hypothetical protein CTY28_14510 [Hyphomicrobium sp.]|nr:MAG: hypothetical protein CTY28_14510 [Hyphomicrobium sp.]